MTALGSNPIQILFTAPRPYTQLRWLYQWHKMQICIECIGYKVISAKSLHWGRQIDLKIGPEVYLGPIIIDEIRYPLSPLIGLGLMHSWEVAHFPSSYIMDKYQVNQFNVIFLMFYFLFFFWLQPIYALSRFKKISFSNFWGNKVSPPSYLHKTLRHFLRTPVTLI